MGKARSRKFGLGFEITIKWLQRIEIRSSTRQHQQGYEVSRQLPPRARGLTVATRRSCRLWISNRCCCHFVVVTTVSHSDETDREKKVVWAYSLLIKMLRIPVPHLSSEFWDICNSQELFEMKLSPTSFIWAVCPYNLYLTVLQMHIGV
jgi:hypothetical protein